MDAADWDFLAPLFEQALALPPAQRKAFLAEACPDDTRRAELMKMLATHEEAAGFFGGLAASVFAPPTVAMKIPPQVGHFEILGKLGGGGMGVVYKARDTRLDRLVALKFLPPSLSHDDATKTRFVREAKMASALDHPHLCTIHEIGEADDGQLFIAMAFYPGETLKKKIARGPLPLDDALRYTTQIARGLEKAHAAGIIHRDIKPANVMVTNDGRVKILDFGLAKIADVQLTATGMTMGTVAYMSPEQTRGEEVDGRTDLWSLGVVLYEMLTGERPFRGHYDQALVYAILNEAPVPLRTANPAVTEAVETLVGLCLEKEPALRYPAAGDLLADLDVLTGGEPSGTGTRMLATGRRGGRRSTRLWAGMGVLTILLLVALTPVRQAVLSALGFGGLPAEKHLVVLPLISDVATPAERAFTDGLAETLVSSLDRLSQGHPSFWVVPTRRVQQGNIETAEAAWRAFGANMALTVAVERTQGVTNVDLNLIDAATEEPIRKASVARLEAELNGLRADLVVALADLLDEDLTPTEHRTLLAGGTAAPQAYAFYTQGLGYLKNFSEAANIEAALTLFERALDRDSSFALAYAGLGEAYWRKYEQTHDVALAERAELYCERAIELDDQLVPAYVSLGLVHTGLGRYGTALAAFRMALSHDSTDTGAYNGLAKVYQALDRLEQAEATFRRAIRTKPDYWESYHNLAVFYYTQGRYEEAATQFQNVIDLAPFNAGAYSNLGGMYDLLRRPQDALEAYQQALALKPNYALYANLAKLYFYQRDFARAAETYAQALELEDSDYRVWGYLGTSYQWAGHPEQARQAYTRAIEGVEAQLALNPRDREARAHLANYYAGAGDAAKAHAELDRITSPEPADSDLLFRIGVAYEFLGERTRALAWLEKALGRGFSAGQIENSPALDDLRADPRFQELAQRLRGDTS